MFLARLKPVPTLGLIMALLVALAFPPLLLAIPIAIVVVVVRKARAYRDPQAVAFREAERWYQQNG
jgi:hypothetical protein